MAKINYASIPDRIRRASQLGTGWAEGDVASEITEL